MAVEKPRNLTSFMIYSYLKDGSFTAVKRDAEFKGVLFLSKMVYLKGKGLDLGADAPRIIFF